jgi:hypothetical protein
MFISRRGLLGFVAGAAFVRAKASQPGNSQYSVWQRRYRASATITLLSIPLVSRGDVGSGFILIEEAADKVAIQFGAGSYPESARGLNRLGFIQEVVAEKHPGELAQCAYFAFMTTSAEKNIEQAQRALEASGTTVPYAVAEGAGRNGSFVSKLDCISLSSRFTWRDYPRLTDQVRATVAVPDTSQHSASKSIEIRLADGEAAPATFLYAVRTALMNAAARTVLRLTYNAKEFLLRTAKEPDPSMGAHFAGRNLVSDPGRVILLKAHLTDGTSGVVTPFKVWLESGQEHLPPLRFEYQAKSFLRLAFEFDPDASGPPIEFALRNKEDA